MSAAPDPSAFEIALQHVAEQIRAATASGQPLRIRGGGSKDFYGAPPPGPAPLALLDTRPLRGITSYQPSELVVTVRAGTPLAELEAALAEKGQCLPFEPPHFSAQRIELASQPPHFSAQRIELASQPPHFSAPSGEATVGGMVAAGLAGPARASVGGVRDYVLGLSMLNGRAEHLTFGGQVMKNVAGYDVSRLMVGALGTLGVLTEISLKVLPVLPGEATLQFDMPQAQALQQLNLWGGQPLPLNASCWVQANGASTLYVRLRGAVAAVDAACKTLGGQRLDAQQAARDWALCRDQRLPWFEARGARALWRVSVPQAAPVLDLPAEFEPPLVEWHGAQRWYQLAAGQGGLLRQAAAQVGGHATLFMADSPQANSAESRFDAIAPPLLRIMRQLKREFDPAGVFNPGRLHADF